MNGIGKSTALQTRKIWTHICGVCGRLFARKEHVRRHVLSHTGEKPFKCSDCARQFARQDILSRHRKKLHAKNLTLSRYRPRRDISSETQAYIVGKKVIGYSAIVARKTQTIPTPAIHNNPSFSANPGEPPSLDHEIGAQRNGIEGSEVETTLPSCSSIRLSHQRAPTRQNLFTYEATDFYGTAYPIASTRDGEITAYGQSGDASLYGHAATISPSVLHTGASVLAPDTDQVPSQTSWLSKYATPEPRRALCSLESISSMDDVEAVLTVPNKLEVHDHAAIVTKEGAQQIDLAYLDDRESQWLGIW